MAHEHAVYMLLVEAAATASDAAALRHYAPRLEELAERDGHRLYLAIALRGWGVAHRLAGEYQEAEARLKDALELFRELEAGWQVARTQRELGLLALARSDNPAALEHFNWALEAFQGMGAAVDAEVTQRAMAAIS
jgi:tetratricopeptide (TPR) repeat protein